MKINRFIMLFGATVLLSAAAHAQKVVTEGSGATIKVIIDASGIPHTTQKKARTTKATNTTSVPVNDLYDIASAKSNENVYKRFEVSKVDNSIGIHWKNAIDLCVGLNYNGSTGWRLPTQRELMLIWVLYNDLKAVDAGSFTPFSTNDYYWCSTELGTRDSWSVSFVNGHMSRTASKTIDNSGVRCVRDI